MFTGIARHLRVSLNEDDKYLYDLNGIPDLEHDTGLDIDSFYE